MYSILRLVDGVWYSAGVMISPEELQWHLDFHARNGHEIRVYGPREWDSRLQAMA